MSAQIIEELQAICEKHNLRFKQLDKKDSEIEVSGKIKTEYIFEFIEYKNNGFKKP